jgi:hypothetical protein
MNERVAMKVETLANIMTMVMLFVQFGLRFRSFFEIAKTAYATTAVAKIPIIPEMPTLKRAFSKPATP